VKIESIALQKFFSFFFFSFSGVNIFFKKMFAHFFVKSNELCQLLQ